MSDSKLTWVLTDDRPGNYWQGIGLAEALGYPYKTKQVDYNSLIKIPNFLKLHPIVGITKESRFLLLNQFRRPSIIISAGRRTAPIALFLKKHYDNAPVIQIMNPDMSLSKFDWVIIPEHDNIRSDNVINSAGSLNRISDEFLKQEYRRFANQLDLVKSPKVAVLIGGSSKKGHFNLQIARELTSICVNIMKNMDANLLITTSRRTDPMVIEELKSALHDRPHLLFEWEAGKPNPYFALLYAADYIIVTGDSISMCSEACSTGKPVYIYNPRDICSEKHLRLHQYLFRNDYAKQLTANVAVLKDYLPTKLSETLRIAALINSHYKTK